MDDKEQDEDDRRRSFSLDENILDALDLLPGATCEERMKTYLAQQPDLPHDAGEAYLAIAQHLDALHKDMEQYRESVSKR